MYESGTTPDKPFKKSARVVGDVICRYHPHGDRAIYDTMVRMAQDFPTVTRWSRVRVISCRDDDPPAAMRYTEAALPTWPWRCCGILRKKP